MSCCGSASSPAKAARVKAQEAKHFKVAGHDVAFPRQPYGVQLVFMDKLIRTIEGGHNALLEAPTGCGKTLALLCGALAWQTKCNEQQAEQERADRIAYAQLAMDSTQAQADAADFATQQPLANSPQKGSTSASQPPSPLSAQMQASRKPGQKQSVLPGELPPNGGPEVNRGPPANRIYYATRTHSQIAQVVSELKRTAYRPTTAILGSKAHYCIHEGVSAAATMSVDEGCDQLRDTAKGCPNNEGTMRNLVPYMSRKFEMRVHDIEDLVAAGRQQIGCPYYAARKLAETAEIVFCPYNYIVDPVIRESVSIDLRRAVVIFDEAHNIEDTARDAASVDLTMQNIEDALADVAGPACDTQYGEFFRPLQGGLQRMQRWLRALGDNTALVPNVDWERFEAVWSGGQIRTQLEQAGLCPASMQEFATKCSQLKAEMTRAPDQMKKALGNAGRLALSFYGRLLTVLGMLYAKCEQGAAADESSDFRLVVARWIEQRPRGGGNGGGRKRNRTARRSGVEAQAGAWRYQFSLWCLNPACVFEAIGAQARSVIVTSGTLAPMVSFQSELGVPIAQQLEAPHVIAKSQVLAMAVAHAPAGHILKATFQHSSEHKFQDGVGEALVALAGVVPDGMLVFMPSYGMMEKLARRWEETGLWARLTAAKPVWTEPHGAEELEASVQAYYAAIKARRGALYLAVCRGKVSEGINFADEHARAVVLLGIPFPAFKDAKVRQKKAYNSHPRNRARGLISGDEWYSLQAYRAMNQALGRCIRHKQDYGAIILLDERLRAPTPQRSLSRWLRDDIVAPRGFADAHARLQAFFAERVAAVAAAAEAAEAAAAELAAQCGDKAACSEPSAAEAASRWEPAPGPKVQSSLTRHFNNQAASKDVVATGAADPDTTPLKPASGIEELSAAAANADSSLAAVVPAGDGACGNAEAEDAMVTPVTPLAAAASKPAAVLHSDDASAECMASRLRRQLHGGSEASASVAAAPCADVTADQNSPPTDVLVGGKCAAMVTAAAAAQPLAAAAVLAGGTEALASQYVSSLSTPEGTQAGYESGGDDGDAPRSSAGGDAHRPPLVPIAAPGPAQVATDVHNMAPPQPTGVLSMLSGPRPGSGVAGGGVASCAGGAAGGGAAEAAELARRVAGSGATLRSSGAGAPQPSGPQWQQGAQAAAPHAAGGGQTLGGQLVSAQAQAAPRDACKRAQSPPVDAQSTEGSKRANVAAGDAPLPLSNAAARREGDVQGGWQPSWQPPPGQQQPQQQQSHDSQWQQASGNFGAPPKRVAAHDLPPGAGQQPQQQPPQQHEGQQRPVPQQQQQQQQQPQPQQAFATQPAAPAHGLCAADLQALQDGDLWTDSDCEAVAGPAGSAPAPADAPTASDAAQPAAGAWPQVPSAETREALAAAGRVWFESDERRFAAHLTGRAELAGLSETARAEAVRSTVLENLSACIAQARAGVLLQWMAEFEVLPAGLLFAVRFSEAGALFEACVGPVNMPGGVVAQMRLAETRWERLLDMPALARAVGGLVVADALEGIAVGYGQAAGLE